MKKINVFELVLCGVMAALSIVLEKFVSLDLGPFKLTFYGLPLLFVGIIYGPKLGLITGIVTGVILQLTSKYGVTITSILWALAPVSWGGISGIIFKYVKIKKEIILIAVSITCASLCATILNTIAMFGDLLLINDSYYTEAMIISNLPLRIVSSLILIIPYTVITEILRKSLTKIYIRK